VVSAPGAFAVNAFSSPGVFVVFSVMLSSFLFNNLLKAFTDLNFKKYHVVLWHFFDGEKNKIASAMP